MSDHGSDSSSGSTGSAETGTPAGSAENTAAASRDSTAANDNSSQHNASEGQGSTQPTTQRADVSKQKEAESKAGRVATQATESVGDAVAASNAAKTSADRDFFRGAADAAQMAATKARREEQRAQSQQNQKELRTLRSKSRPPQTIDNSKFFGKVKEARERGKGERDDTRVNEGGMGRPEVSNRKKSDRTRPRHQERSDSLDNSVSRDRSVRIRDDNLQGNSPQKDARPDVGGRNSTKDWSDKKQDYRPRLSEEQKIERKSIALLEDGIGYRFGSAEIEQAQVQRFDEKMGSKIAEAKQTGSKITIISGSSRPGTEETNQKLAVQRGENLRELLIEKYGLRTDQIEIRPLGETSEGVELPGSDEQDSAYHRVARVEIHPRQSEHDLKSNETRQKSNSTISDAKSSDTDSGASVTQKSIREITLEILKGTRETAVTIHNVDAGKIGVYSSSFLGTAAAISGAVDLFDSDKDGYERVQGGISAVEGLASAAEGAASLAGAAEAAALAGAVATIGTTFSLAANTFYGLGVGTKEAMEEAVDRNLPQGYATGMAARILGYKISDVKNAFNYLEQSDHDSRPVQRMVRAVGMQAEWHGILNGFEVAGQYGPQQQKALFNHIVNNLQTNELIDLSRATSAHSELTAFSGPIYRLVVNHKLPGGTHE